MSAVLDILNLATGLLLVAPFASLLWLGWTCRADKRRGMTRERDATRSARAADQLLRDTLPPDLYTSLQQDGYLEIPSRQAPHRKYRIDRDPHVRTTEAYERADPEGQWRLAERLCVLPDDHSFYPAEDRFLTVYLGLLGDEERFLATANRRPVPPPFEYAPATPPQPNYPYFGAIEALTTRAGPPYECDGPYLGYIPSSMRHLALTYIAADETRRREFLAILRENNEHRWAEEFAAIAQAYNNAPGAINELPLNERRGGSSYWS